MPSLFILLLLLIASVQRPADVVQWSATGPGSPVRAGEFANIRVVGQVQQGWKLYAVEQPPGGPLPLTFALSKGSPFEVGRKRIVSPRPKIQKQDENFSVDTHYYENEAVFSIPVAVPRTTSPGTHQVPLEVTFQACGAAVCLRPFTQKLDVAIPVRR